MTSTQPTPTIKPTTAGYVSRILGKRETRSTSHGTRVRGYRSVSQGFTVMSRGTAIWVEYTDGSGVLHAGAQERKDTALTRYAQVLTDAGFVVEKMGSGTYNALISVLGKTDTAKAKA